MNLAELSERLRAGDRLHMQIMNGRRIWWLENPHANVSNDIVMSALHGGEVREAGDSLFGLPMNSQTYLSESEYAGR